jgi:hypothetical protein
MLMQFRADIAARMEAIRNAQVSRENTAARNLDKDFVSESQ